MKRLIRSFGFAFNGLYLLVKTQRNAQIHLVATLLVIALGCYVGLSTVEWALILLCIGLVVLAEALNSSIEFLADFVTEAHHEKIKKSKDLAAGGVLAAAIIAATIGCLILVPKIMEIFR